MFSTFGPEHLKSLLSQVGELAVRLPRRKLGGQQPSKGIGAEAVTKFLSAAAMTALLVPFFVIPQGDILTKTGDALCGAT